MLKQHEVVNSRFECRLGGQRDHLAANCATAQRVDDQRIACDPSKLAIRIPVRLPKGSHSKTVPKSKMAVDDGMTYARKAPSPSLVDLVGRITPENTHGPIFETKMR